MERVIKSLILSDLKEKMVFLSGPRQSGKTTLSKNLGLSFDYLNYDRTRDRKLILREEWDRSKEMVILDELHKMRGWKAWLKGIFDTERTPPSILVTGSARLDTFRKGGESLAGRHFLYRLHPFTVKELKSAMQPKECLERILRVGPFPEPFLRNDPIFAKRWRGRHTDIILKEDLHDLEKVRDIKLIEVLVDLLKERVGSTVSYSSLAEDLQVSVHTVKHWLQILENLYVIFAVRPYHKNIARSLLKESKYYFFDTASVATSTKGKEGARIENAVACGLLRELHFHEDTTGSRVELCYLRDRDGREVDFLTLVDRKPVHMIEVKSGDDDFSANLKHFLAFFKGHELKCIQAVHQLKRSRSTKEMRMMPVHELLAEIEF